MLQAVLVALCTWVCASGIEFTCWSIQLCSPIIFGPIVGAIMGNMELGLQIGCATQLVYMGNIMVGGVGSVDYPMAGCVATALAVATGAAPEMGVTIAVSFGLFGMLAESGKMTLCSIFVHRADKCAARADTKGITFYNVVCPQIINFFFYFIPAFLAVRFGAEYLTDLLDALPEVILTGLEAVGMLLPALGIAMLMKAIFNLKFLPYFIIGYVLSSYLELGMIAVSLVGVAFALMYWFSYREPENSEEV
ncbi:MULTISPECIES: PTS mannose/fructose/sorbose/N-acetylgalactosamine transporter subunit IIC [Bacillota]|mgnify:CR=1 FL=1|nr:MULTISPECIES: PTS sugar transporter subunit IIC [Bacillota]MCH4284202.1 PTS sugar transporter subunit IIC [Amedibacillus hominis]